MSRSQGPWCGRQATATSTCTLNAPDEHICPSLPAPAPQVGLYRQASFGQEELITLAPGEPNLYVRYGDVLLTLGSPSNARTARAYYSKAVQLTRGSSARALYGLVACAAQLQVGCHSGSGGGQGTLSSEHVCRACVPGWSSRV